MIPAKIEQFLKSLSEPDFFCDENRDACEEIHELVREYVRNGTALFKADIDAQLLLQAEKALLGYGWTSEETMVLFCMWCIVCPERISAWYSRTGNGGVA